MHLAELNIGRLIAPPDDPLVAEFMDNLDRINGLAKRMPGFVWMMEGSGEPGRGNTETCIDGDPRFIANLSVWETPAQLETFVFGTLHNTFLKRRQAWFEALEQMHFVMWWVEEGTEPTLDEALAKLDHRAAHGDSPDAFGWDWLRAAAQ
ncbi:DUF3291 domain-containing protein [Cognatiyoonia sp. IB215182]|uniref:DUF3291 domain-containing protein n=1 Tax=Cognatiyoonia sp. IB215182 TaxID=3097353 RepID=UPI002A140A54|nr:DUF3291 domain-containing protein [Cognatiyoonia sp. IB215182]MDX8352327.1 DUF3291 domain-containing protein [Cognatiyoonia sp. IB215182]